jgi:opacity protein-like surface antigen
MGSSKGEIVRKLLPLLLVLALIMPATALNKDGLLSIGGRVFYWMPMGDFGNAYTSSVGFGAKVGYGLAENFEFLGEAWYGMAGFNEDFWGDTFDNQGDTNYYLVTFQLGGRLNLSPYSPFDPYIQAGAGYYSWASTTATGNDQGGTDYTYHTASDDKFGINLRAGGEFFTSNEMSVDVGVEWNSIFGVTVPVKDWHNPDDHSEGWDYSTEEQTVNVLSFGIGLNLYF